MLAGFIPAVIRECVERAKLHAISARPEAEFFLTSRDIVRAAKEMQPHLDLLSGAKPATQTPAEIMAGAMVEALGLSTVTHKQTEIGTDLGKIKEALGIVEH